MPKLVDDPLRKHGFPVLVAFARPDDQAATVEVDVFHAQRETLPQSETGPVDEHGHESIDTAELPDDLPHLGHGENHRKRLRDPGAYDRGDVEHGNGQYATEQEEQGIEGLVLGGAGNLSYDREVSEESLQMLLADLRRISDASVCQEPRRPTQVGLLGTVRQVPKPYFLGEP